MSQVTPWTARARGCHVLVGATWAQPHTVEYRRCWTLLDLAERITIALADITWNRAAG